MPQGLVRSGDFRKGTPVVLPQEPYAPSLLVPPRRERAISLLTIVPTYGNL